MPQFNNTAFLTALLFLVTGIHAARSSTCGDLERKSKAQMDRLTSQTLQLEKYILVYDSYEDVRDMCNIYRTCSECLRGKKTPTCGWCFLSNRCSLKENCNGRDSTSHPWIPSGADGCPKIRAVKPHMLPAVANRTLDVTISPMPAYNKSLICSYEMFGTTFFTKGRATDKGVSCPSPRTDITRYFPKESTSILVTLSIELTNGPSLVSTTNFTFFECGRYASCSECTSSPFPCAWCSMGNKCTHDVEEDCRNDVIIFSKAVPVPSIRQGPAYCFRILPSPSGSSNEILVPSGLQKRISVREENILHSQASTRFTCRAEGYPPAAGQLLGDTIYCDQIKFRVTPRNPIKNVSFDVYWGGGSVKMDNPMKLRVVTYDCSKMAFSCGECLDLHSKFQCGWCEKTNTCTMRDDCEHWNDGGNTCTKPEIVSFYPKSGLLTRPTNITIKGINFGREFEDIAVSLIDEDSELIAECKPFEHLFVKNSEIVCLLDVPEQLPENNGSKHGFFEVRVQDNYITVSGEEYVFVDPSIREFQPLKGLKSGGTYLTIQGSHLDAGREVEAFVGDVLCEIVSRDFSKILCITSPSPRTRSSALRVIFDGEEKTSSAYFFYVEDPYIKSVRSEFDGEGPAGKPSGGSLITVKGENFDHVENPFIYVTVENEDYPGDCMVESPNEMKCLSPRVPADLLNFCNDGGYLAFDYGFRMGNLEEVRNISNRREMFSKFQMYADPFFKPFAEQTKTRVYKSGELLIEVRRGSFLPKRNDITVEIGVEECPLRSLSTDLLTCQPPYMQPEAKDGDLYKLPEVVVKVRGVEEYFIGFLRYE